MNGASSNKIDNVAQVYGIQNLERILKMHYWLKSYGDFADLVDLAY